MQSTRILKHNVSNLSGGKKKVKMNEASNTAGSVHNTLHIRHAN